MEFIVSVKEVLDLHDEALRIHGGDEGVINPGYLDSAVSQPYMTYDGEDLYPTLQEKAAAIGYSLAKNHAFNDGNKRVALLVIDLFLLRHGYELNVTPYESEFAMLCVADGAMSREGLIEWIEDHIKPI